MIIEQTIRNYLITKLTNIPIEVVEPSDAPSKYIVFRVIDQGIEDHIKAVTIEAFAYGASVYEASSLNEQLKEAMLDIIELNSIFSCKIGGGGSDFNNEMKRYRYRSYFNIFY